MTGEERRAEDGHRPPDLDDETLHVWCARLDLDEEDVAGLVAVLSGDEKERAARFALPMLRRRFAVARGVLRRILASYTGEPAASMTLRYGSWGKPALADPSAVRFSLSHTGDLAVVAVHASRDVGIDLETLRPIPHREQIAARFLSPDEHRSLMDLPPEQRDRAFLACWTRKEAYVKAVGGSVLELLKQFDVSLVPGRPARILRLHGDSAVAARWSLREIVPAPAYLGAVAVEGPLSRMPVRWWTSSPG